MSRDTMQQLKAVLAYEVGAKAEEITDRHVEALIQNLKDMLAGDDFCDRFEARGEDDIFQFSGSCQGCGHYLCKECIHYEGEEEEVDD